MQSEPARGLPDAARRCGRGHDVAREPDAVRATIAVTGQFSAVDNLLTGQENLQLMADLNRLGRDAGRARVAELLERFDLVDAAHRPASTYSGRSAAVPSWISAHPMPPAPWENPVRFACASRGSDSGQLSVSPSATASRRSVRAHSPAWPRPRPPAAEHWRSAAEETPPPNTAHRRFT